MTTQPLDDNDIAIIGMAGRFPGARNVAGFWQNLCAGVESIHFFTDEELEALGVTRAAQREPNFVKARAMLDDPEWFDATFFGYTPKEAEIMDPQQRVLLECAWEALEDAGYDPERYPGSIGVYAGATISTYLLLNLLSNPGVVRSSGPLQIHIGNAGDFLTTRVSYKLNLKGPSCTVQTACSTSLVALHMACESLLNEQCDMALAGGVSINVRQRTGYHYLDGGMESPDGHCRAFDADAQGTLFGSGAGVVVLKRLRAAWADRDHIYAVIKGSAINNDGSLKVGYTAPSVEGQARVIAEALGASGVDAGAITYIETHGTGTSLGDPIEIQALTKAFRAYTQARGFCAIGSVKTNIGHLEAAAGVASLIKTTLALQHRILPPSLNFERPNPEIDFANSPFYVNAQLAPWQAGDRPNRAAVSSFGFGGTNAHVILEEAPPQAPASASRGWQLLLLSAKTETALEQATANLAAHLAHHPDIDLADVAYTLQAGRQGFQQRRMLVCRSAAEALGLLEARDPQRLLSGTQASAPQRLVFLFPGRGAQYPHMARDLYLVEPAFRALVDRCCELLRPHLGDFGLGILDFGLGDAPIQNPKSKIQNDELALFVIEYALAQLWISWGVRPQAMIGHDIGEYVAACLAGVLSLEDALRLVAARARLMQALPPGAEIDMLAEPFAAEVRRVRLRPPALPYMSNVTGTWITAEEAIDPAYWVRHLRRPARFAEGVQVLLEESNRIFLEVGPGQTLAELLKYSPTARSEQLIVSSLPDPGEGQPDGAFLLATLGMLWLRGIDIDWAAFYAHERRRRVHLPTYPFERQRYWIEAQEQTAEVRQPPVAAGKNPNIAEWFYQLAWKRSALPTLAKQNGALHARQRWLVFVDSAGLGHGLAERLHADRQTVICVLVGEHFSRVEEGIYCLNPGQPGAYEALIAELRAADKLPDQIVHCWNVSANAPAALNGEAFMQAQTRGFYSLLFLVQAWEKVAPTTPVRLSLIANGLYDLTGAETVYPTKAPLLGIAQVIPQEYPHIACRCIDVALSDPKSGANPRLIDQILAEVTRDSAEVSIAYRGLQRWAPQYEPLRLESDSASARSLRERGVYLITGGLDGAGYALAEYLARTVQARLILTDAAALPEQAAWPQWPAAHTEQDRAGRAIRRIQLLQALGAEVLVCAADLAQRDQVQAAVERGLARFGALHGVIHAAAAESNFAFLRETNPATLARQVAPKVQGLLNLEQVLRNRKLDFRLLASSLVTVLGGLGYAAYAAANHVLNAFAREHNRTGPYAWICVNWDAWQLGQAAQLTALHPDLAQLAITPLEGGEALRQIVAGGGLDPVIVSTENLAARIERGAKKSAARGQAPAQAAERVPTLHPRPRLQNPYVAPANERERSIAEIWQKALGFERVGVTDNFFELGGDSFAAMHLIAQFKQELNIDLPVVSLYEGLTVRSLSRLLAQSEEPEGLDETDRPQARANWRRQYQQQERSRRKSSSAKDLAGVGEEL